MEHILAAGGMIIAGHQLLKAAWEGGLEGGLVALTGYSMKNEKFYPHLAKAGIPLAIGLGGSYIAAKSGVNNITPTGWNL